MVDNVVEWKLVDRDGSEWVFKSLDSLNKFLSEEIEYWEGVASTIDNQTSKYPTSVISALKKLQMAVSQYRTYLDSGQENTNTSRIRLQAITTAISALKTTWLWSSSEYVQGLIYCGNKYGGEGEAAYIGFIFDVNIPAYTKKSQFLSILIACENLNYKQTTEASAEEKGSLFKELYESLSKQKTELYEEVEEFKESFNSWDEETKATWDEWLAQANEKFKGENKNRDKAFSDFMEDNKDELLSLKNTYEAHLKLESPAKYWGEMANKYSSNAYFGVGCLMLLVLIGLYGFFHFYSYYLQGQELGIKLDTVKGLILFGTGAAIYTYLIRIASKLTFSSFHLHRDAQEREQLTYFYLALIKEGAIDENSRDIVLQSLFSRTDTGLLGGDSSPTMPLADLIRGMRG